MNKNIIIVFLVLIVGILGYLQLKPERRTVVLPSSTNQTTTNENNILSTVSGAINRGYISSQTWPPAIHNSPAPYTPFICEPDSKSPQATKTEKIINGRKYCITSFVDGGAGHWGGEYTYVTENYSATRNTKFNLSWSNCGGYGGPGDTKYDQCKKDQSDVFDNLDAAVDALLRR
jgi:hypothetical protein